MVLSTQRTLHWSIIVIAVGFIALPSHAFMRWNEGKDTVHVNLSAGWMYDSNVYTDASETSDNSWRGYVGGEYRRHAGLIGVNIDVGMSVAIFRENADLDFSNPNLRVELTKDTGRTTGTLAFSAFESTRADPRVNARTNSNNYAAELRLRYPINTRNNVAASFDWIRQDFDDNELFVDIDTASVGVDWYYIFTPERDLFGGYRVRLNETSAGGSFLDHSLSAGVAGRIVKGLNGTARIGYQTRSDTNDVEEDYSGFNASLSGTWNYNKRIAVTATVSKDLNVTSTNISTDETRGNLDIQYARSAKLVMSGGVGAGQTKYLGLQGGDREDFYFTAYARAQYSFSEKLRLAITYSYFQNWSTDPNADFPRQSFTFDVISRF